MQKLKTTARKRRLELGATITEMSLLVSLIAIVALSAIQEMGESFERTLCRGKMMAADYNDDGVIKVVCV